MIDPIFQGQRFHIDGESILRTRPFEPYVHVDAEPIDSSLDTLYTVPSSTVARVWIEVCNNSAAVSNLTLHRVESGGSAGVGNMICNAVPINPNVLPLKLGPYHLEAAGIIQGISSVADALTAHITVEEYGGGDNVSLP